MRSGFRWLMGLIVLAAATPVAADPISMTSGALAFGVPSGYAAPLTLNGTGFTYAGSPQMPFGGRLDAYQACLDFHCRSGATVSLFSSWSGHHISGGIATLDGRTFTAVGSLAANSSLFGEWTGTLTIPTGFTAGTLSAPFLFTGGFSYEAVDRLSWQTRDLAGAGTATLTFSAWPPGGDPVGGSLFLDSIRYDFESPAATPEPASMLLLGTGLAAVMIRRRSSARRR